MASLQGIRNSTRKRPPPPSSSSRTPDAHADDSTARPPKRAKRGVAAVLNATVAQSVFGSAKPVSLAKALRSARRLLSKEGGVDEAVRARKEVEIKILTAQLADKQRHDRINKVDKKYKMIKFIERQKVQRRLRSLQRQLTLMTGVEKGASEEEKRVRAELEKAQKDLDYIDYYPKGTKYIALFPSHASTTSSASHSQRPKRSGAVDHDEEDEEGEPVFEGEEERQQREAARAGRLQRREAAEALQAEESPADGLPLQEQGEAEPMMDEATRVRAEEDVSAAREKIRELVKRAKAKVTAGDKKAAAAAQGAGSKKEKRRREFKDDFFLTEHDEGKEQRDSRQPQQPHQQQSDSEQRSAAPRGARQQQQGGRQPSSRAAHLRGSDSGERQRASPPAAPSDSVPLPPSSSRVAPPSHPAPAPARSLPSNDRKRNSTSSSPRLNRRVVLGDGPSPSTNGPVSSPPLQKQRRDGREKTRREEKQPSPQEATGGEEKQQTTEVATVSAATSAGKKKRKGMKRKSGAGVVDEDREGGAGAGGEGAVDVASDDRAVEREMEQRQRERLRQSVQSILGLDREGDDDDS